MILSNQRIRNLTTGKLHTQMKDIYVDIEAISGTHGIMAHMLPKTRQALLPHLRWVLTDQRFWDGELDGTHTGETDVPVMTSAEKVDYLERVRELSKE